MHSFRSCSVSDAVTSVESKCRSFLDTINSMVRSLITRHHTGQSSEHRDVTISPSPQTADPPLESSKAVYEESQIESDVGWLDLGSTYTKQPDDDNNLEKDAWLCFDLETKLRRQADHDDFLQGLMRKMRRDRAELVSWQNSLSRCTDEYSRSKTVRGRKEMDAWKDCLDRESSRRWDEYYKLREEHNHNLTTFMSGNEVSHLLKQDGDGWFVIPEVKDYLQL